eukprot:8193635-Lingulodinium_polyedra.AAC.1
MRTAATTVQSHHAWRLGARVARCAGPAPRFIARRTRHLYEMSKGSRQPSARLDSTGARKNMPSASDVRTRATNFFLPGIARAKQTDNKRQKANEFKKTRCDAKAIRLC